MIHEVDESLRALVQRDALNGSGVEVAFDAPTKEWAARRNQPTLDLYLYQIQEAAERRGVAYVNVRGTGGTVVERRPPQRHFKLSYLITAWTQRPEDEHRLLSAALSCFLRYDIMPTELLAGALADQDHGVLVSIGQPLPPDRNLNDVWSALGGELKPALDLIITAPFPTGRVEAVGPPVREPARLRVTRTAPDGEQPSGAPRRRTASPAQSEPTASETLHDGTEERPGRAYRIRELPRP